MAVSKPHVIIIGAGVGGLALAQILRRRNIPFSIFERRIATSRPEGWAIALHTIIKDLVATFPDDLPPFAESVGHLRALKLSPELAIYPNGKREARHNLEDDGSNTVLVRANRQLLLQYLGTHIPVQYGKKVVGVTQEGEGVTVTFADGASAKGDIVVGADGVHSAVRRALVPGTEPKALPLAIIIGEVTLSGAAMAEQLRLGRSAYLLRPSRPGANGHGFFVGTNIIHDGGESGDFYWMMTWPDEKASVDDGRSAWHATASREELLAHAVAQSKMMDPALTEIVRITPASGILRPPLVFRSLHIAELPAGRVTLLGDAAHCMAPFRGEGGMHALTDAVRLGEAIGKIADEGANVKQVIGDYVKEMLERGNRAVTVSEEAGSIAPALPTGPVGSQTLGDLLDAQALDRKEEA